MLDLNNLFSRKKGIIGIDIGSSSLKLVEISESSQGYSLNRFSEVPLPRGVIIEGILKEPEILAAKLAELVKSSEAKFKDTAISVSGHTIIIKKASFPIVEEDELRQLILDEADKYLPFDNMEDIYFDFYILGESDVNPSQMDVILAAARKDIVLSYAEALKEAGLNPEIVDVDCFALETMYETNYDTEQEGESVTVLVNIGASITNINVVRKGCSIFTRDFAMGGNLITEAIQDRLGISFEQAEELKTGNRPEVSDDLLSYAEPLILEIERSVDYFRGTFSGENISRVMISGGSARIQGLTQNLSSRLNIETEMINPFRNIASKKIDPETLQQIGPAAAVGVGLALRRMGN